MTNPQVGATVAKDPQIADRIKVAIEDNRAKRKQPTSLLALADTTGIAYPTLRRSIEGGIKGHRSLTVCELGAIATALQVRPSALIEEDDAE